MCIRDRGFVGGYAGAYIENALKPFGIKSAFYHVAAESRSCINICDEVNKAVSYTHLWCVTMKNRKCI